MPQGELRVFDYCVGVVGLYTNFLADFGFLIVVLGGMKSLAQAVNGVVIAVDSLRDCLWCKLQCGECYYNYDDCFLHVVWYYILIPTSVLSSTWGCEPA